jgi:diguanylate cyclase (GGDEF)-like protein
MGGMQVKERPQASLRERLRWKDPLRPDTLISKDRGLMARAYGIVFLTGSLVVTAGLLIGAPTDDEDWLILLLAGIGAATGIVALVGGARLPVPFFFGVNLLGTALITVATTAAAPGAEGVYAVFYVWLAILAGLFCNRLQAGILIAAPVIAFAVVLDERDAAFAPNYALTLSAVMIVAGTAVALLRDRIEELAGGMATDARTDSLTGLANRRAFDERFKLESDRAWRTGEPMAVAICDLDGFKAVNDRLGHQAGDVALTRTARIMRRAVRSVDDVARLGGEEFALILPGVGAEAARVVVERVRLAVRSAFGRDPVPLTISCGLAELGANGEGRELLRAADAAMYGAKAAGKDRTHVLAPGTRATALDAPGQLGEIVE